MKNAIKKMINLYKQNLSQYSVTNILIIILTIATMFISDFYKNKIFMTCLVGTSICVCNFFAVENLFKNKKYKIIGYIISIIISGIFAKLIYIDKSTLAVRICTGYLLSVILITIIKIIKESEINLQEYTIKVFKNSLFTLIIYGILNIGITILTAIFCFLILDGKNTFDIISKIQIALLGFFLAPGTIIAFTNTKEEVNKFIKNLVIFVLVPLSTIAAIIIYLYMIKILLLSNI